MTDNATVSHFRWNQESSDSWVLYTDVARIVILCFVTVGGAYIGGVRGTAPQFLYVLWFAMSLWYLRTSYRGRTHSTHHIWIQIVIDFVMVAITVVYTHGPTSLFTFIFVIIVLESGLFLGLRHALTFATLAAFFTAGLFLFGQSLIPSDVLAALEERGRTITKFELWYSFAIQSLAFYLTAFLSGYWSNRLTRMERFQSEILDNMNSGFLITDEKGIVVLLNKAACLLLNRAETASIGTHVSEILPTESGGECPIVTALRSGKDFTSYEFHAAIRGTETRLLGLTTNCIFDTHDSPTGLIASFTDLTVMDEMRNEMRQQDRLAVVGELAAGLAHEIRNPVAVIRGAIDEMNSLSNGTSLESRLFAIALRESDHLNDIVSGFLDFAREPSMKREMVDLGELLEEVQTALEIEYSEASGTLITLLRPSMRVWVSGDRSQLKQVLVNLGKNGIEAMDGTGTLHFHLSGGPGPVEVRIEDEGPGIPPDEVDRIFEPFFTTKSSGVGMGLAVCSRIVTAHDGTLRASSREGGGCAMSLSLPAAKLEEVPVTL